MKRFIVTLIVLYIFTGICQNISAGTDASILITVSDTDTSGSVYYEELTGNWKDSTYVYGYDDISSVRVSNSGNPSSRFSANLQEGEYRLQFFRCQVAGADEDYAKFYTKLDGQDIELTETDLNDRLDLTLERGWVDIGVFEVGQSGGLFTFSIIQNGGSNKFLRLSAIRIIPKHLDSNSGLDNITVKNDAGVDIPFSTAFETDNYAYIMYVGYKTNSVSIIPTVSSEHTDYIIESDTSQVSRNCAELRDGVNIIKIRTLAEDKINSSIYTIKIIKSEYETIDFNMPDMIEKSGNWSESTVFAGPTRIATLWSSEENAVSNTWVKYKPQIEDSGVYIIDIYRVYTLPCDRYVKWEIYHNNELETFYVDNSYIMCDTYETLGAFYFNGDGTEYVKVSRTEESEEITRISAVRYRPVKDDEAVISYPTLIQNEKAVSRMEQGKDAEIVYSVYNYNNATPLILVAGYTSNCLNTVSAGEASAEQYDISQITTQVNTDNSELIKCFVWDSEKTIKPLTNAWTFKQ